MNRQGWIIAAAIVAAVAVGAAFYFLRGGEDGDTVPPITGAERAEEARGVLAELERERAERERAAAQSGAAPARAAAATAPEARGAGAADVGPATPAPPGAAPAAAPAAAATELDTAFARAQAFRAEGQLADAQVLYFFAARGGHGGAAFELATMNDPLHHKPETSFLPEPEPFQAYRWYTTARGAGVAEAIARLAALRTWATAEAAKGNAEAERLLLQWE